MDVAVQLLQQLRSTQLGIVLQEHQRHLALRTEERFGAAPAFMAFTHQTEVHCHLMQGKKTFHASKLTVFERNSKKIIKVEILEGQSLGYSRNSSSTSEAAKPSGTFAIAIDLQFPRFALSYGGRGGFFLSCTKGQNFYYITNQLVIKFLNIWRHSLFYPSFCEELAAYLVCIRFRSSMISVTTIVAFFSSGSSP